MRRPRNSAQSLAVNSKRGPAWMQLAFYNAKLGLMQDAEKALNAAAANGATDLQLQLKKSDRSCRYSVESARRSMCCSRVSIVALLRPTWKLALHQGSESDEVCNRVAQLVKK